MSSSKMHYLMILALLISLLKPVKAADLPVPPFKKLWTSRVMGLVHEPTVCDKVICFDSWPCCEPWQYGAADLKTGKILWKKTIEGYHTLTKTCEKNRYFIVIERTGADIEKLTYTGKAEVLVLEPVSGKELLHIPIDEVGCDPTIKDSTLYCVFGDDQLKAIDLVTQKTRWAITIPEAHRNVLSFSSSISRKRLKAAGENLIALRVNMKWDKFPALN
ncbi:MAG: hypothetical protein RDV48_31430 [Candidatus Eremiobacteraeota bacterium]|nr:hypothetical protein [Candidatus Eremiobacteraeota bacterium]